MAAASRTLALTMLMLPVAVAFVPTVAAETREDTICFGGETDKSVTIAPSRYISAASESSTLYLSQKHLDLWSEDNGVQGLQRTDRVCYDRVIVDGVIVSSTRWIDYEADEKLAL